MLRAVATYRSQMQNESSGSLVGPFGLVTWAKVPLENLALPVIAPDLVVVKQWPRIELSAEARDLCDRLASLGTLDVANGIRLFSMVQSSTSGSDGIKSTNWRQKKLPQKRLRIKQSC